MSSSHDITRLLIDWGNGDQEAFERLVPLVENELHRLARYYMRRERPGHLLQTTALVNEAYIRLIDQTRVRWQNRAHFFGVAATMMRRILLNHARAQQQLKRGGGTANLNLDSVATITVKNHEELIALDEALERLYVLDERKVRVVEMRFFGGLTAEESAMALGISPVTVAKDWDFAKSWLRREMQR